MRLLFQMNLKIIFKMKFTKELGFLFYFMDWVDKKNYIEKLRDYLTSKDQIMINNIQFLSYMDWYQIKSEKLRVTNKIPDTFLIDSNLILN